MYQSNLLEAQKLLNDFLPKTGKYYSKKRNYTYDIDDNTNTTSLLSPYIRYRLISEEEVLKKTLSIQPFLKSQKFIEEIYWRTYWKGWLEHRKKVYDDYLNESCLLVLSHMLDNDEKIGLVYPDYFYVDENENFLELDNRKKIGKDVNLLDLPAHGACTMLRTVYLKELGGYSEDFVAQDGHEIWYKFKDKHKIVNVSTPLFHYRQHPESLSKDNEKILNERKKIKRSIVGEKYKDYNIAFVVGAKNTYKDLPNIVLKEFQSKPLIDYTLGAINNLDFKGKTYISTDDDNVEKYCRKFPQFNVIKRPELLSSNSKTIEDIIYHAVTYMEKENDFYPDIVIFLNVNSPLKNTSHILKAIDTLIIHNCDSVVSVYEDYDLHFRHKRYGLQAISKRRHRKLRIEREALFADNRAINVSWRKVITENDSRGKNISHIIMDRDESINIKSQII